MVIQETDKIKMMAVALIYEHDIILNRVSRLYEFAQNHLSLLSTYSKDEQASVEKIAAWKSTLKMAVWQFYNLLKDHVERETAFLGTLSESGLDQEELRQKEEVLEHIDELAWLLDNTPIQKMPDFKNYFAQKFDELFQGVRKHCQQVNQPPELIEGWKESFGEGREI